MKPRRILIFSTVYYPRFVGGAEVAVKEITDRISQSEVEFDMITLRIYSDLPRFERVGNINVHRVGWSMRPRPDRTSGCLSWYLNLNKYAFLFTGLFKAMSLNRDRRYDVIWSLMASYGSFAAVFFKLMHPSVPFVFTLQDGDPISHIERRAMPLRPFFKMMFTRANHVTAISKYLAGWAKDMGTKAPITVIPNAVDLGLFKDNASTHDDHGETEALKQALGKKSGDVFLITTSRLVAKNAVGDIIAALEYLPANVKLLILGEGHLENNLRAQSERLLTKPVTVGGNVRPNDRVQFLGYIPHAEMPKYLRVSDIFIRPALSEGLGNSFLEAMAASVPIIGTPVGGITDFLIDGETGLFCEVNNPRSIAQKVEKLMRDQESRDYIIKRAREMVTEKYDWVKVAAKMKSIFVEVS